MKVHLGLMPAILLVSASAAGQNVARWSARAPLLEPGPPGTFDETSVKDPSIVRQAGKWHLFYTARGRDQYSIGHVSALSLEELQRAGRRQLTQLRGAGSPYGAAPQVFYFTPQKRWYLIFQTTDSNYQPVFSNAETLDRPDAWSSPRPLADKREKAKWIDFWVICDAKLAYLFFTRDHRDLMVMTTRIEDFPKGFGGMRAVFSPLHEAAHVYRVRDEAESYLMIFELATNDRRSQGLATATSPAGPWKLVTNEFAAGAQLNFPRHGKAWTNEVSHGEFIRAGFDERLEIRRMNLEFLIQGMPSSEHKGDYPSLPWRLGLIRLYGGLPLP